MRRYQVDFVELKRGACGLRGVEMPVVHRIECAAQQSKPSHVTCRAAYATA